MPFIGKVCLISDCSEGIGSACAEFFAKKGAFLSLVGPNEEMFETVLEKIRDCGVDMEPLVILADVTVDAERIIAETIERYGRLDVLINNSNLARSGSIETVEMDDYDVIMATNVRAVFELSRCAIPHLIESKGNIVNISNVCSLRAYKNCLPYSMAKAAVDQFTRCAAIELADKGVRVNSINPRFNANLIDTDFQTIADSLERSGDEYNEMVEEINNSINAIAFLSKDISSFISGAVLPVDGAKNYTPN